MARPKVCNVSQLSSSSYWGELGQALELWNTTMPNHWRTRGTTMGFRLRSYRIHRFLLRHAFYALALSSRLAVGILAGRVLRAQQGAYIFLVWNLFLAWVPYGWSLWAASIQRRYPREWWRLLLPGALWLLFFPNAPYIITDFVHLYQRPVVPL